MRLRSVWSVSLADNGVGLAVVLRVFASCIWPSTVVMLRMWVFLKKGKKSPRKGSKFDHQPNGRPAVNSAAIAMIFFRFFTHQNSDRLLLPLPLEFVRDVAI